MKKTELLARIEALELRLRQLSARLPQHLKPTDIDSLSKWLEKGKKHTINFDDLIQETEYHRFTIDTSGMEKTVDETGRVIFALPKKEQATKEPDHVKIPESIIHVDDLKKEHSAFKSGENTYDGHTLNVPIKPPESIDIAKEVKDLVENLQPGMWSANDRLSDKLISKIKEWHNQEIEKEKLEYIEPKDRIEVDPKCYPATWVMANLWRVGLSEIVDIMQNAIACKENPKRPVDIKSTMEQSFISMATIEAKITSMREEAKRRILTAFHDNDIEYTPRMSSLMLKCKSIINETIK